MKLLVTGAAGMLGRAVVDRCAQEHTAVGVDLVDGDLTDPATADHLLQRHAPDWLVHCAAYTDVDGAESAPELALAVNAEATGNLAAACRRTGAGLTYISTDYVFTGDADGYDEDAPRDPVNQYGQSKALGEQAVEALTEHQVPWQIVRTSWLFGAGPTNFVKTIRRLLSERERLQVVTDQRGCPTYATDLAELLCCLIRRRATGKFHGTNRGVCSWFEFAQAIAVASGADPGRIDPCATEVYPTPARRPVCSVLRDTRLAATGCQPLPSWQDGLRRYVAEL